MFLDQADRLGEKPFLWNKSQGSWSSRSYALAKSQILALAGGLRALGLETGDRVMLVSENRPEWAIADLATMAAGGVTVPAYTTNTVADHLHILNNSGAKFVVVSTRAMAEKVLAAASQCDHDPILITLADLGLKQASSVGVITWDKTLEMGKGREREIGEIANALTRTDLACIIYTSGTGGAPKGVMLSHGALLSNCRGAWETLKPIAAANERFLSFLPLSHAYEHTVGLIFPISVGAEIYYAESIEQLAANMAEVHPTIMTAVPRLYEMMRAKILHALSKEKGLKPKLFMKTVELGRKKYEQGSLGLWDGIVNRALDVLVRKKVAARFGGELKALVSGGAPLAYDVGVFFIGLGVRILQGYGQTEFAPVISCNAPNKVKIDTVGPALEGVELRIADDGEILIRGESLMLGYWKDPVSTANTIRDGWLHTGDIGEVDQDGYVRITDRKKDIIVNSGGDNVSPQRVEGFLTLQPEIAQAMAYGDRRPHLVALVVPDQSWAESWAKEHGKAMAFKELVQDAEFKSAVSEAIGRVNKSLSNIEKIRRFTMTADDFNTDNGMLTPTLKIRRHVIRQTYGDQLEALYDRG